MGVFRPEEISYLEKNDPVALKKYRETKEDKESYKEKLRQCKTKEEVDRVKPAEAWRTGEFIKQCRQ